MAELKHDESKKDAAKPNAAKPARNYFGVKNAVVAGLGLAAVVALFARAGCDGQDRLVEGPERRVGVAVTVPSVPTVIPVCASPTKGDNVCDREKGEHDVNSKNWDPQSCGYCGDLIRQDFETAEACPVDFHDGNGRVERNVVYGAYIAPRDDGGVYSLSTITISESCRESDPNYAAADCAGRGGARPGGSGSARPGGVDRPPRETTGPAVSGGQCPSEVLALYRGRANALKSGANLASIRQSCPESASSSVTLQVGIRVQGGFATVTGISGCGSQGLSVNLGGIPAGVDSCTGTISVPIPPG